MVSKEVSEDVHVCAGADNMGVRRPPFLDLIETACSNVSLQRPRRGLAEQVCEWKRVHLVHVVCAARHTRGGGVHDRRRHSHMRQEVVRSAVLIVV